MFVVNREERMMFVRKKVDEVKGQTNEVVHGRKEGESSEFSFLLGGMIYLRQGGEQNKMLYQYQYTAIECPLTFTVCLSVCLFRM